MDAPSAQAVKLARLPLRTGDSDEELLAALQSSLQPIVAEALRALRARARAEQLSAADAAAAVAQFLLATASSSHRQSLQLHADVRAAERGLAAEQARHDDLVEQLSRTRAVVDHNAQRKAALRASETHARGEARRCALRELRWFNLQFCALAAWREAEAL